MANAVAVQLQANRMAEQRGCQPHGSAAVAKAKVGVVPTGPPAPADDLQAGRCSRRYGFRDRDGQPDLGGLQRLARLDLQLHAEEQPAADASLATLRAKVETTYDEVGRPVGRACPYPPAVRAALAGAGAGVVKSWADEECLEDDMEDRAATAEAAQRSQKTDEPVAANAQVYGCTKGAAFQTMAGCTFASAQNVTVPSGG